MAAISLSALFPFGAQAQTYEPNGVYLFYQTDSTELYLNVYNPAPGSQTRIDGKTKPCILFGFGGGFKTGSRDDADYLPWYKMLNEAGYKVVSFDYRLGMKGFKTKGKNLRFIKRTYYSVKLAAEDMLRASAFLVENAAELGIDPNNIVASGSSAGAIAALQSEWEICNSTALGRIVPQGFNYSGVIAFAGAVFSKRLLRYKDIEPCPCEMFYGTMDNIVPFDKISALNLCFAGSSHIARVYARNAYDYRVYRYPNHGHEIALAMTHCMEEVEEFLEKNVMDSEQCRVDVNVDDPSIPIPSWAMGKATDLYK